MFDCTIHVLPCHRLPCPDLPCHAMLCLPCHALPCLAMPCLAMPCFALPCHALSWLAMPCHAMLHYFILHHVHATVCYVQGHVAGAQRAAACVRQPRPGWQGQAALLLHAGARPCCGQCLCRNPHRCLCQGMLPDKLTFLPPPPHLSISTCTPDRAAFPDVA